jgi:hypothetical protein
MLVFDNYASRFKALYDQRPNMTEIVNEVRAELADFIGTQRELNALIVTRAGERMEGPTKAHEARYSALLDEYKAELYKAKGLANKALNDRVYEEAHNASYENGLDPVERTFVDMIEFVQDAIRIHELGKSDVAKTETTS